MKRATLTHRMLRVFLAYSAALSNWLWYFGMFSWLNKSVQLWNTSASKSFSRLAFRMP